MNPNTNTPNIIHPNQPSAPITPGTVPPSAPAPVPSNVKPPKKQKIWVWIVAVLVVLAAAGGGYYYYKHYYHKAKPVATTSAKRDISLIRVGISDGSVSPYYPDPNSTASVGDIEIQDQIFEGLIGYQGGNKFVPLLATSWTNPNESTWIFTLRPNVKFHSGHTMTATDVKYSIDNFKDTSYGSSNDYGSTIKATTILAPDKIQITTDGPDPTLLGRLAVLDIIDSHNAKQSDPTNGTGPYTLKPGTDPSKSGIIDLVAYDNYWGGHVYSRELQFSFPTDENQGATLLKDHKLDIYSDFSETSVLKSLQQANISTIQLPATAVSLFQLNTKLAGSPLTNLAFRQALNLALNRDALITASGKQGTPINQLVPVSIPGYDRDISVPKQNITQAKALIAQSGIKNPTLTLSYTDEDALGKEAQTELAAIGVTLKLNPIADLDSFYSQVADGKLEMSYYGFGTAVLDASDVLQSFSKNPNFDDPTFDQVLTSANQTIDAQKHIQLLQKASQILSQDVAVIPVSTDNYYTGLTLKGANMTADIPSVNLGVYFWKIYQR